MKNDFINILLFNKLDHGLREYDFAARRGLPLLGRFDRPDPLAADYPALSPYLYCAANPMMLTDPSGCYFTQQSIGILIQFEDEIKKRFLQNSQKVSALIYDLGNADINNAATIAKEINDLNAANDELNDAQSELEILKNSSQRYNITHGSIHNNSSSNNIDAIITGGVKYDYAKKNLDIYIEDPLAGCIAHELKHAYQFETGDLSSGFHNNGVPFYDTTDEVEAYSRGSVFGITTPKDINVLYPNLQRIKIGVSTQPEIVRNTEKALQKIANNTYSVFRWQKKTYINVKMP